jgi:CelD/BcsL family acetyltransferase involved in cellulose biosynthesis
VSVEIEDLTTAKDLEAIRGDWSRLWERCPAATPFQAPEWLLPWWKYLGRGRLWVLAVRSRNRLVGLAPLSIHSYYGLPLRRVSLLGTGASDYLDVLLDPEATGPTLDRIFRLLAERRSRWDFCDFQQLPPSSSLRTAVAPPGWNCQVLLQEVCPVLTLPNTVGALPAGLPARLRSNLRYYRRRLGETAEVRFETANEETLPEFMETLFRLHQARWNRRMLPGGFASPRVRRFHGEVAPALLERGWLRPHGLRINGNLQAVMYCLLCRQRAYYYLGGFNPDLGRFSLGTLLIAHALEDAIAQGAREFDFLRGDEPYKYLWGARNRENRRLLLWQPSFPASLAPSLNRWERTAESLLKAFARVIAAHSR